MCLELSMFTAIKEIMPVAMHLQQNELSRSKAVFRH